MPVLAVLRALMAAVPGWVWAAAAITLAALSGKLSLDLSAARLAASQASQAHAADRARWAAEALAASERNRALEARWTTAQEEIARAASAQSAQNRVAQAAANAAGDGLRIRAAAVAADCRSAPASTPAASSPAALDPGTLLADVLGRLEEAGRELAAVADARGVAGAACERAYDALRAQPGADRPGVNSGVNRGQKPSENGVL